MLSIVSVPAAVPSAAQETPLWRLILENIPFDPAAIVLYVIFGGSIWLVWWGHRHSGTRGPRPDDSRPAERGVDEGAEPPTRPRPRDHGRGRAA